jgi:hypothetical protein
VARRFRSEKRVRLGAFKRRGASPRKKATRQTGFKSRRHFETERLAFDRQPLGEPGEETRFLDQLFFSPADEQSRVLTLD